jgi:predicted enzyme related to lactoylglutathione lyase
MNMAEWAEATVGHFCWAELQTRDPLAAREFYGELFGWRFDEMATPQGAYTLAKVDGKLVAGLMHLPHQASRMGALSSWSCYIAVDDVDASADAAAKLGGRTWLEEAAIGPGRLAIIEDPTGAVFTLRDTRQPMGTFLHGEPGALAWNELLSTNVDVTQRFYSQLFGWKAEPRMMTDLTYAVFKDAGAPVGGLLAQPSEMKGAPSFWVSYFAVDDVNETFARATKLGGKILLPFTEMSGVGHFGWLLDPQGVSFAIVRNVPPADNKSR